MEKSGFDTAHSDFVTVASPSEAVAEQRRRNEMIRELRAWLANPFEEGGPTNDRQVPVGRLDGFPRIRIGDWWERAVAHAHNVLVSGVAIEAIAKRFFDGHPVLFKNLADSLRDDVSRAELVIEHCNTLAAFRSESDRMKDEAKGEKPHNDDLKNLFPCLCPIDLGQLKEVAQAPAAAMVEQFVGRAKAETLSAWGERRAALDPLMKLAPAV
ncbi:MAG: hypothetical protein ABSA70_03850 [Terriglobia bacterium]